MKYIKYYLGEHDKTVTMGSHSVAESQKKGLNMSARMETPVSSCKKNVNLHVHVANSVCILHPN